MFKQMLVCLAMVALLLAAPKAEPQDAATGTGAQTTPATSVTSAPAQQPAAKVWTNDDLGNAHGAAPARVAPNSRPAKGTTSAQAKNKPANNYQAQISKLEAELPPIDSQIAELQAALSGNQVNETRKYGGVRPDNWQAQLDTLEKKRAEIKSQIDALEDQARHAGVPTNSLP
jgi:hypothetical protein